MGLALSRILPTMLQRSVASGLAFALASLLPGWVDAGTRGPHPVQSLAEIRSEHAVLQRWDLSCGAAALATLLNFQHGDPADEREIALGLMGREEYLAEPLLVRIRQGFSLLDLKRFVDQRGYRGTGLAQMTLADLVERAPIMVPIEEHGYNHFVVFRGQLGKRVLLADPAFGARTMLVDDFERAWPDHDQFGRVGFVVARTDGLPPPDRLAPRSDEFVSLD